MAIAHLESLEDLADPLGMFAAGDQQGVRSIHHDEILDAEQRHHFAARIHEVAGELAAAGANAFVAGSAVFQGSTKQAYQANIDAIRLRAAAARGEAP